ncbi:hypothetical protein ACFWOB_14515 [Streptomyces sp. NPDC058420]|uniref:hypothetical protein n=1 Tax=Streptomyces sp. NPDC058420 TaxID=3346489 RepID=UPI00364B1BC7
MALALPAWAFALRTVVDVQQPARRAAAVRSEPGGKSAQRRVALVAFISDACVEHLLAGIDEVGSDKRRSVVVHRACPPVTASAGKPDELSCVFSCVLASVEGVVDGQAGATTFPRENAEAVRRGVGEPVACCAGRLGEGIGLEVREAGGEEASDFVRAEELRDPISARSQGALSVGPAPVTTVLRDQPSHNTE